MPYSIHNEEQAKVGERTYRRRVFADGKKVPYSEVSKWEDLKKANYNRRNYCSDATCGHKFGQGEGVVVNPTDPTVRVCKNCYSTHGFMAASASGGVPPAGKGWRSKP